MQKPQFELLASRTHQQFETSTWRRPRCLEVYRDAQVESCVDQGKPEHYEWAMTEGNEIMFVAEIDGQIIGSNSFARDEVWGGLRCGNRRPQGNRQKVLRSLNRKLVAAQFRRMSRT